MQKKQAIKMWSFFLSIVLIVAMALVTTGCNDKSGKETSEVQPTTEMAAATESQETGDNVLGEGNVKFVFSVTDQDGNEAKYEIQTDKKTVGEALLELGLIAGDEGDYGLYVKTVDGITADYDKDGSYWAFYVDGEYAQKGVDQTEITEGAEYSFKIEK